MTRASSSVKLSFAAQRRRISSRFSGRVCLITGASDRGIGGAVAERLAREGAAVSLLSRSRPRRLLDRLQAENADVMWKECDVRHQDQIDAVVEEAVGRFGKLDTVVNSAGVEMVTSVDTLEDDQWLEVIDVNLTGVMRVIRAVLPQLDQRGGGVIVNIASVAGMAASAGLSAYSASKAGVMGMTLSLAQELASRKIRVVGVAPALVKTPMAWRHVAGMTAKTWEEILACHPLGIGRPADVAAAVAFLASEDARWISGVTLPLGWMPSFPISLGETGESR